MMCNCQSSFKDDGIFLTNWLEHIVECKNETITMTEWKGTIIEKWPMRNKCHEETQTDDESMTEDEFIEDESAADHPSPPSTRKRAPGGGRRKGNILNVAQQQQNLRLENIKQNIKEYAEESNEEIRSIYFALLHNYLRSVQPTRVSHLFFMPLLLLTCTCDLPAKALVTNTV